MEALRLNSVVFCGENPHIVLVEPGTERVTAAASYWQCTYSAYGEGQALLLYLDADNAAALGQPSLSVYADNAPLARYLVDTFNQHFEGWESFGFGGTPVQPARFFKESDSRQFYRVACHGEQTQIELLWGDIRHASFRTFPDLKGGGFGTAGDEHYHVANVIFLCGQGGIRLNQQSVMGEPETRTLDDGRFSSSVFLALSETWMRKE